MLLAVVASIWLWRRKRQLAAAVARSIEERRQWHEFEPRANQIMLGLTETIPEIAGPTNAALVAELDSLEKAVEKVRAAVEVLSESTDQSSRSSDIESRTLAANRLIAQVRRKRNSADQLLEKTRGRNDAVKSANDELTSAVGTARSSAQAQLEAGWRVDPLLAEIDQIEDENQAMTVQPPIDLEIREAQIADIRHRIEAIAAEATEFPDRYHKLFDQANDCRDRTAALESDRRWLEEQLEAWALMHHWESFAVVAEHPPSIEGRLTETRELLANVMDDGGMLDKHVQDIRGAAAAIEHVNALFDESAEMIDQARELNAELARSAVDAKGLVPAAEQASAVFANYVRKNSHDLDKGFSGPAAALRAEADQAAAHLELRPPNSLESMNLSNHVTDEAHRLMQKATAEVARMNKKRSAARASLSRASSAVNALDSYTDGIFAELFGGSRRTNVERLQASLRSAGRKNSLEVNDPDSARKRADAIAAEATRLLEKYKRADAD